MKMNNEEAGLAPGRGLCADSPLSICSIAQQSSCSAVMFQCYFTLSKDAYLFNWTLALRQFHMGKLLHTHGYFSQTPPWRGKHSDEALLK